MPWLFSHVGILVCRTCSLGEGKAGPAKGTSVNDVIGHWAVPIASCLGFLGDCTLSRGADNPVSGRADAAHPGYNDTQNA